MVDKLQDQPCYSVRLVRPIVNQFLQYLDNIDSDERIPITIAHGLLKYAIDYIGDPYLGIKAGGTVEIGDAGALDYAMNSAATVKEAIMAAIRYIHLINDGLDLHLDIDEEQGNAIVRFETQVVLPDAAEDFMLGAFYSRHIRNLIQDAAGLEIWFVHATPNETKEFDKVFSPAKIRFARPHSAFVFDKKYLEVSLKSADYKLHSVIRKHADQMLAELPKGRNMTERVRNLITKELPHGHPSAEQIARRLRISQRTLGRRLEDEGTTFKSLLDDLRRRLALRYMTHHDISLSEVAFLLGFSQSTAFHRAFKRWTGKTPLAYRRENKP